MNAPLFLLGIETSCDETAVAIVSEDKDILSNHVYTQLKDHRSFGGVVPELAARAHLERLPHLLHASLQEASLSLDDITAFAATGGPGLMGGVLIGVMYAKALAARFNKPFLAINHLEAHALTARLTENVPFPFLVLLMAGGHTQFLWAQNIGDYKLLGTTQDDAVGEAFDKVAKLLNLGYPGGPRLEKHAQEGDPFRFSFPKPLFQAPNCHFSFSGLKTAVFKTVEGLPSPLSLKDQNDISASFQYTVGEVLLDRCKNAFALCQSHYASSFSFVMAGGVASNVFLRQKLQDFCAHRNIPVYIPPISLCTDNGAMVAWAGIERYKCGLIDDLSFTPRPRWPLEEIRR